MKKWTEYLNEDIYRRLCECRTIKSDLPILINAKWKSYKDNGKVDKGWTIEDAIIAIFELLESNNINWIADITVEEYNDIINNFQKILDK